MTTRLSAIGVLALLALCVGPAASYAQGDSGVDQYREGVPGGGGDTPTENVAANDPSNEGSSVDDRTSDALVTSGGTDGERLADLANATAPKRDDNDNDNGNRGGQAGKADVAPTTEGTEGTEGTVQSSLGDGPGGLGWGLPLSMGVGLAAAVGFRLRNRSLSQR